MLCSFEIDGDLIQVPQKTIIVNTDFTWKVLAVNKTIDLIDGIPKHIENLDNFLKLMDYVDCSVVCPSISDDKFRDLAMSGGRNGIFRDKHGKFKAKLSQNIIRPIDCSVIVEVGQTCQACKAFKKSLSTMISNEVARYRYPSDVKTKPSKTEVDSHCPWKFLTEEEREERVKLSQQDRKRMAQKIKNLENKFQEVSIKL